MIRIRDKVVVLTASVTMLGMLFSGCGLIEKKPEAVAKEKLAKVGDEYIIRSEVDEMMVPVKAQLANQNGGESYLKTENGKEAVLEQTKTMLNSMVEQKILEQKATELNLFKDEQEIEDAIAKELEEFKASYDTEEDFNKMLEENKISDELLNKMLRNQVIYDRVYDEITKDASVTEDEIKEYYEKNKNFLSGDPSTMEVSHILVKTEEEAKDIKTKIDNGEDFANLAKTYSIDTATKENGGSLGQIYYDDPRYEEEFVEAAMALNEGEVSEPISTQNGYHIIKVTKKDVKPVIEYDEAKDTVKGLLLNSKKQEVYEEKLTEWKKEKGVKIYENKLN